ncbi:MAG: molybdopterin-dependent oxidoreductase, partial [Candidatus Competibacteraceae bacterium]|nr:molybdopterin-dependent oxidoreductase [Candidatus Competibacteraceae bacterium]
GLVVAMQLLPFSRAEAFEPYPTGGLDMPHGIVTDPHVFVSIDPDGTVTLVTHRSEMGTGARTGVPMVLADELEADWNRVKIVQAPGDEPKYGNQDTDGSRSLRHYVQPMRQIGASVRLML